MKDLVNDGFAKVVKPYIDAQNKKDRELVAPVEVSPAEAAHSVGDQIIYNGLLYDVTAPIAVGDSLATSGAGANISASDNIEAQIKATKSQIQAAAAQAAAQNKNTQEMLAPVEEDETDASRAYAIGEQLILDGILYNVIDPIAQHGIITAEGAGANIEEADDVTTQLSSLNSALSNKADSSKAYQTDDTTENSLASDDVLPFYDTSATAKRKMTVQKFGEQLICNRNLLDNSWFTVNQRGASSYNASGYCLDRWINRNATCVVTKDSDGIIIDNSNESTYWSRVDQIIENELYNMLLGKTVTISVLFADGQLESKTGVIPSNIPSVDTPFCTISDITGADFLLWFVHGIGDKLCFSISTRPTKTTKKIRAVKLELGSVSTLALDTAPNYAEELLKCQRYFEITRYCTYHVTPMSDEIANGVCNIGTYFFKVPKRASPTITILNNDGFSVWDGTQIISGTRTLLPTAYNDYMLVPQVGGTFQDKKYLMSCIDGAYAISADL